TLRQPRAVSRLGASWLARRASTPLRATVRIRLSTLLRAMKDRPHRTPRWNRNGGFLVAVAGRSHACTHSEEAACGTNLCARQSAASSRALRGKVLAPGPRLLLHRGSLHVPTEIPAANSDRTARDMLLDCLALIPDTAVHPEDAGVVPRYAADSR